MTKWDAWNYPEGTGYVPADGRDLVGFAVRATDGGIGHVDEATHEVGSSYVVVDTGPWIFGSKVMLPAGVITNVSVGDRTVYVSRTRDQIKEAPPYQEQVRDDPAYRDTLGGYYYGGPGFPM